jgi:exodeoxyribonuclease VII large subunit
MELNLFTVSELSEYLKTIVTSKKIKVSGEVSQPKLSGGHLYFTLKDSTTNLKSIIWKSKNINKESIIDGNKITIECRLDFYGPTGNVNLIVDKIITNEKSGELHAEYEKIKNNFILKKYFDQSRKKPIPDSIKNILVLTSENGAALQDFIYNLTNNHSRVCYDVCDVKVQGSECPTNICQELINITNSKKKYDLVIITRGGGSFEDLFGFSQPELIEAVYNFNLPVLSAIGHQIDNPLLDLIADISAPTPSLAAQFIVDQNKKYLQKLKLIKDNIREELLNTLTIEQHKLNKMNEKIIISFKLPSKDLFKNIIIDQLKQQQSILRDLESKLTIYSTDAIFLYDESGDKILDGAQLAQLIKTNIKLKWCNYEFTIKIIN